MYAIFFLFIFLYTIPAKLFFFDEVFFSGHNQHFTYQTATSTTLVFSLFLITVNLFIRVPRLEDMNFIKLKNNSFVFWLLYVVSLAIVIINKRSGNLYDGSGDAVEMSVLNEYVIILFFILYIYSGGNYIKLLSLVLLYALYAMFALLSGGRIEVVLLLLLLLNIRFQYTVSFKKLIIFFVLGVWSMSIFGSIRHNPQLLLSSDFSSILNPFTSKVYFKNSQGSNEGDVYWASERMMILIDSNELNSIDRCRAGVSFFLSALIPTSELSPLANLSNYKMNIQTTGGGGLAPVFFYAMFGFVGVVLLGLFVAKMLNQLAQKDTSDVKQFYIILVVTMVARWFAYYPIPLIKFCVYGAFVYYLIGCIDYTMKKCRE